MVKSHIRIVSCVHMFVYIFGFISFHNIHWNIAEGENIYTNICENALPIIQIT